MGEISRFLGERHSSAPSRLDGRAGGVVQAGPDPIETVGASSIGVEALGSPFTARLATGRTGTGRQGHGMAGRRGRWSGHQSCNGTHPQVTGHQRRLDVPRSAGGGGGLPVVPCRRISTFGGDLFQL